MEDEIDIKELLLKLYAERGLIIRWCCIAVVVGLVVGFSIPREFTSTSKMAPETTSRTGGGNLSSLASLAGINLSSMSTSDAVSPDIYPEVINSTPFVVGLFSVPVEFKYGKETLTTDLYTYLKEYQRSPWWSAVIRAPFKALGWILGKIRGDEKKEGYSDVNPYELTKEQSEIAKGLVKCINASVDKKTSVITVSVTMQDAHVAAKLATVLVDRIQEYVTDYRTDKARKDQEYYQQLFEEAREEYYEAQKRYARYMDANQGVVLQRVRIEQERLENEAQLAYQLYNNCAQQLQLAKAKVQQETPVCTILQPASVPLVRSNASKSKILAVFIFLGLLCSSLWILYGREALAGLKSESASA